MGGFKLPTDPAFAARVRDIVGVWLKSAEPALVPSVEEKSQIPALARTQPILPLSPGVAERQAPDDISYGTTTLRMARRRC